jgi:hypothetical protein
MSLCWRITGDANYAGTAITILNRWAATCTNLCGDPNVNLLCFSGYQFACAAENLRGCTNWAAADFGSFQAWMTNHWYPLAHNFLEHHDGTCDTYIWANWDLCNLDCLLAIGVLCDRRDIYNYAINYYEAGAGNGAASRVLYHLHPGYLGQCQESGRDQGHCTLDPISLGVFCEIAWNQGDDLYGWNNNTLLAVSEYVCKYNVQPLTNTVPYHTFMNCHQDLQTVPGAGWRGNARPGWDLICNHYANRQGIAAPYTLEMARQQRPDGMALKAGQTGGIFDQVGFTTLTHLLDPLPNTAVPAPGGLLAQVNNHTVTLSWWGSAQATSYNVKRSTNGGAGYTTIASGMAQDHYYTDAGLPPGTNYHYVVSALINGEETKNSLPVVVATNQLLSGTAIGSPGSHDNGGAIGAFAFDGTLGSYYDAANASGDWTGLDLGGSHVMTQEAYCPRPDWAGRMVGGQMQGSNARDFSRGVVTLFTVDKPPADTAPPVLTHQTISNLNAFRYVRYLGPPGAACNVAEVQFYGYASPASAPPANAISLTTNTPAGVEGRARDINSNTRTAAFTNAVITP